MTKIMLSDTRHISTISIPTFNLVCIKMASILNLQSCDLKPFPKRQILDSSKLKEFVDDNFKFDENGKKLYRPVENTVGKGEISPFLTVFSKDLYCRHVKSRACLGKG